MGGSAIEKRRHVILRRFPPACLVLSERPSDLLVFHHILSGFLRVGIFLHPRSIFHSPVHVLFDKWLEGGIRRAAGVGDSNLLGYFDDESVVARDAYSLKEFVLFIFGVITAGGRCCRRRS